MLSVLCTVILHLPVQPDPFKLKTGGLVDLKDITASELKELVASHAPYLAAYCLFSLKPPCLYLPSLVSQSR